MDIQLSDAAQRRAELLGTPGQVWIQELPHKVKEALNQYGLTFLTAVEGGSESYLALAQDSNGIQRILKVLMPSDADVSAEIAGLRAANGRGYVRILEADASKDIVVMERLGSPIAESGLTIQSQISQVTRALQESWQADTNGQELVPGERKADWLENHLRHTPGKIGMKFDPKMIHRALDLIANRRAAWLRQEFVLAHGDPHEYNTLAVSNEQAAGYRLVDPDGMVFEAAYDLGILLRNWIDTYRQADPAEELLRRAIWLSEQTAVAKNAIISWGFVEIVSTGIHLAELGYVEEAKDYLQLGEAVATRLTQM